MSQNFYILMVLILVLCCLHFTKNVQASNTLSIDVFTQKEPYSGRGTNQPCNVFAPKEEVFLYAFLSKDLIPIENQKIIFEVYGPATPSSNNTFTLAASTNASGIAATNFTLPWAPQSFGEWIIYAKANVSGTEVQDFLWFKVYWMIEILLIETGILDGDNWIKKNVFAKGSLVDVKVMLRNIAWTEKNVILTATVWDSLKVPIAWLDLQFIIQANYTMTVYLEDLLIPKWAYSCNGNVVVTALTPSREAYCPEKNQTIKILPCYYVGGINQCPNKISIFSWMIGVVGLMVFTLIINGLKRKIFRKSKILCSL